MSKSLVLIASLGRTDVQVVLDVDGRTRRISLGNRSQRRFQEDCRTGAIAWEMLSFADTIPLRRNRAELRGEFLDYEPASHRLQFDRSAAEGGPVETLITPRTPVRLCAPLLTQMYETLCTMYGCGPGEPPPVEQILLLTTCRDGSPAADSAGLPVAAARSNPPADEPVAAADLVREQLARAYGIDEEAVHECVFLTEPEMYFTDRRYQKHLRYSAARRIDRAICSLYERSPSATAVISDVGGIAEARSVIAASCRYRFDDDMLHLPSTDRRDRSEDVPGSYVLVPPAESLITRRQTRQLVERGAFEAAAGLAQPSGLDESLFEVEPWRKWLGYLARLVQGDLTGLQQEVTGGASGEAGRPIQQSAICGELRKALVHGWVLPIALRTECLLRRGDYSLALRESFTFLEALELRAIDLKLRRREPPKNGRRKPCVSDDGRKLQISECDESFHDELRRLAGQNGMRVDLTALDDTGRRRLRYHVLQLLPADFRNVQTRILKALDKVRPMRNAATHRVLTGADIEQARGELSGVGLWSDSGSRFLGTPLVIEGLEALNISGAESLFDNLTTAVAADMDEFSFSELK